MAYTTIDDPEAYFRIKLYTGNATDDTGIVFDTTDTTMQPDFVWIKNRNSTNEHNLANSVAGATKYLHSNLSQAETTAANSLQSFDSNGFTVGENANFNTNTNTYVAWCWKESADAGFDIVLYTGNGTDDTDISHSLSAVPHFFMVKKRSDTSNWNCYHQKSNSSPEDGSLQLDETGVFYDDATQWSDEPPTSSVFTLGNSAQVNANTATFLAYLWSEKQGFSRFGKHEGNANADGTFVYTGFRPALVIIKGAASGDGDAAQSWELYDNKRLGYNVDNDTLFPNTNAADNTADRVDILSNGFKIRVNSDGVNDNASTYVYAAFAEAPFVNSKGVPNNAR